MSETGLSAERITYQGIKREDAIRTERLQALKEHRPKGRPQAESHIHNSKQLPSRRCLLMHVLIRSGPARGAIHKRKRAGPLRHRMLRKQVRRHPMKSTFHMIAKIPG